MRVVLDANIYVSALISNRGHPHKIVQAWLEGAFDVLISQPIVDEQLRVTGYERLQKKYRRVKENRPEFVALVAQQGIWVEPGQTLEVVKGDESDHGQNQKDRCGRVLKKLTNSPLPHKLRPRI